METTEKDSRVYVVLIEGRDVDEDNHIISAEESRILRIFPDNKLMVRNYATEYINKCLEYDTKAERDNISVEIFERASRLQIKMQYSYDASNNVAYYSMGKAVTAHRIVTIKPMSISQSGSLENDIIDFSCN